MIANKIKKLFNNNYRWVTYTGGIFMDKNKITDKLKDINTEELQKFYHKNTIEILTGLALLIGAISSAWDFFTGPKLTILLFAIGAILGIFFTAHVRKMVREVYGKLLQSESKTTALIIGGVQIVIGIFLPCILFAFFGLLAGTAFNYFAHETMAAKSSPKSHHGED